MTAPVSRDSRPFDLAIAGELNMDLILYGLPLVMEVERDLVGDKFISTLGSSSAIVAHNAATLGLRVQFATVIGDDDFGHLALARLEQVGVETTNVVIDRSATTGVTILLPHGSERHSLSYLGSISSLTVDDLDVDKLAQSRHLHLSSLFLQTGLHRGLDGLLRQLRERGLTISLDTNDDPQNSWGSPLAEILPLVDLFMPNEGELCRMAGGVNLENAMRVFGESVPTLVVKRGRLGCRVQSGAEIFDVPGQRVEAVDTIGAGDSFDAGFLYAFLTGKSLINCARAGNITGALSTLSSGGTEAFRNAALREPFLQACGFFDL